MYKCTLYFRPDYYGVRVACTRLVVEYIRYISMVIKCTNVPYIQDQTHTEYQVPVVPCTRLVVKYKVHFDGHKMYKCTLYLRPDWKGVPGTYTSTQ